MQLKLDMTQNSVRAQLHIANKALLIYHFLEFGTFVEIPKDNANL